MHSNYEKPSTKNSVKNQKWGGKALLSAVVLLSLPTAPLVAQSPYWLLPEKKLDFTGPILTLPSVSSVNASESPKYNIAGSNAWFDQHGNVVFFLSHNVSSFSTTSQLLNVYKGDGTYVGSMRIKDQNYGNHPHPESLIIPNPDNCKEFFLVVSRFDSDSYELNIDFYTLDISTSPWSLSPTPKTIYTGWNEAAIAASKPKANGESYLYIANELHIVKSEVAAGGISPAQVIMSFWTPADNGFGFMGNNYHTLSLDVSSNGGAITWGSLSSDNNMATVYRAELDPTNGDFSGPHVKTLSVEATDGKVTGVEFHYKYPDYVFATVGSTTGTLNDGIVRFHFDDNSLNQVYPIQGTEEYANSQIETGYNRTVVVAGSDHLRVFSSTVNTSHGTIGGIALPLTDNPYSFTNVRMLPMYINGYGYPAETGIAGAATVYLTGNAQNNPAQYSVPFSQGMTYSWTVTPAGSANPDDEHLTTVTFPQTPGTYTVTVSATSNNNCLENYTKTKIVTIEQRGDHQLPPGEDFRMMATTAVADVQLYPNPAAGSFTVAPADGMPAEMVRLYDLTGREAKTYRQVQSGQPLPLAGLPNGMYAVHISTAAGTAIKRLLVSQ